MSLRKVRPVEPHKATEAQWTLSHEELGAGPGGAEWKDLTVAQKAYRTLVATFKVSLFCLDIFGFICLLGLLADAFQLIGGSGVGQNLKKTPFLNNPISSAIFGMVVTIILQSGSTLISILVDMVAGGLLTVHQSIPIMIGAEIGASLMNALVSLGHSGDRDEFRRAFAAATMNDIFNLLNFITVLPLEMTTGFMEWLSGILVMPLSGVKASEVKTLRYLTDPLLNLVVQIDVKALTRVTSMSRRDENVTYGSSFVLRCIDLDTGGELSECPYVHIFAYSTWSDAKIGLALLVAAIIGLGFCLAALVKINYLLFAGRAAIWVRCLLEKRFPYPFEWFTGYFLMFVAAVVVVIIQSSSVFRSALTPLVGIGVIPLEKLYPLLMGANVGTTSSGILAALSADPAQLQETIQIALCQTIFNVLGVIFFYPIPFLRRIPLRLCKILGNTTAQYRWFALVYILNVFFLFPAFLLALSFLPSAVMFTIVGGFVAFVAILITINWLQSSHPGILPEFLHNWHFLPRFLWDLEFYDKIFRKLSEQCFCCPRRFFNANFDEDGAGGKANGNSRSSKKMERIDGDTNISNLGDRSLRQTVV
ncbi:unnamed protein product [Bursaphelenchus xylophilus]|uniref:(pine wood nematode) hypothetical protein n=1 Tax=Bursaphelenchus xylophilus TaxID=6326 RepID=A0A1I7RTV8_BURXY|nr:unnamed protein product [Bursaphelenchus xylophilus]CAG9132153.1 unnamed protein product [Bursaphelenchus xylophilus]